MLVESKGGFNQNASNPGRWWTQCSLKTTSKDSAGPWNLLKENKEVISVNHWDRESESSPSPTVCRLINSSWSSSCSHSLAKQFGRLLKGKLRKRSGHLFITYFSFILLWSTKRTDKLGKVLIYYDNELIKEVDVKLNKKIEFETKAYSKLITVLIIIFTVIVSLLVTFLLDRFCSSL